MFVSYKHSKIRFLDLSLIENVQNRSYLVLMHEMNLVEVSFRFGRKPMTSEEFYDLNLFFLLHIETPLLVYFRKCQTSHLKWNYIVFITIYQRSFTTNFYNINKLVNPLKNMLLA